MSKILVNIASPTNRNMKIKKYHRMHLAKRLSVPDGGSEKDDAKSFATIGISVRDQAGSP